MKTKSEAKRQAILDIAAQVFREEGFERASMSEICARVGGSKATLYNHFPSKEALFFEVMYQAKEAEFEATLGSLNPQTEDVREALLQFGERIMTLGCSPEALAVQRLGIAEAGRSDIGQMCYQRGKLRIDTLLAEFLKNAMQRGKLIDADPQFAALHLMGLLGSELHDPFLYRVIESIEAHELKAVVERAVSVFMAAYGSGR